MPNIEHTVNYKRKILFSGNLDRTTNNCKRTQVLTDVPATCSIYSETAKEGGECEERELIGAKKREAPD